MSLRSVPDARTPVPLLWWVPAVTVVVLATTTITVVADVENFVAWIALAVSIIGYLLVWWRVRPAAPRTGPYTWLTTAGLARDRSDPPTVVIPARIARRVPRPGRTAGLLINSAAVALGFGIAWSIPIELVLHPEVPHIEQAASAAGGLYLAAINAITTSVLEECANALLILAVAGLAQRYLPARHDDRTPAVYAILVAAAVRTSLHVPLWGSGALGRLGMSLALAWLFWRTRRIWPLILAHTVWDTLTLQTALTPTLEIQALSALAVVAWAITGTVIAIIAIVHSRQDLQCANYYYSHHPPVHRRV